MIGQRLRISRLASGLSLRDLMAKIDNRVTAQAISKYERNESMPSSGVLIALADALDVSVDYLAGDGDLVLEAVDSARKNILAGGKRHASKPMCYTCWSAISPSRRFSVSQASPGISRGRRPGPSCGICPRPSRVRLGCVFTGAWGSIRFRTSWNHWKNAVSKCLQWTFPMLMA